MACCKSCKAFISSKRPVRALPAKVFKSASAMRYSSQGVEIGRRRGWIRILREGGGLYLPSYPVAEERTTRCFLEGARFAASTPDFTSRGGVAVFAGTMGVRAASRAARTFVPVPFAGPSLPGFATMGGSTVAILVDETAALISLRQHLVCRLAHAVYRANQRATRVCL